MSAAESISLLGWVQTPILVGDPDGCIVYANPAFRSAFTSHGDDPMGQPLAMVFGGGAREVVLMATASVLERGQPARLQIREAGHAYTGLASPIEAEDDRVGVVILLLEEQSNEEHLTGLADEIAEPIADGLRALQMLSGQLHDILLDDQREVLERGLRSVEDAQKWLRELQMALRGGKPRMSRFDVSGSIMRVSERIRQDHGEALDLEILMPPNLPRVTGTPAVFERLLGQLVRQRIGEARPGQPMTLLARTLGGHPARGVIVSLVDVPDPARRATTGLPPESLQQGMATMGGESVCVEDSRIGRVTTLRLEAANA
ncbi:MAG: PAS domain-containing protein [Deltaproteobacteria bacterium]|jgi:nitrogen-specific signal transduction histidine kinase|nr:PAS domain-containing protein [Deltaproteobacteria bacterium]